MKNIFILLTVLLFSSVSTAENELLYEELSDNTQEATLTSPTGVFGTITGFQEITWEWNHSNEAVKYNVYVNDEYITTVSENFLVSENLAEGIYDAYVVAIASDEVMSPKSMRSSTVELGDIDPPPETGVGASYIPRNFTQEFNSTLRITQSNTVIDGYKISSSDNHCVWIAPNVKNVTIKNSVIGPCFGNGIFPSNSNENIIIENNYIHDSASLVYSYKSKNIVIQNNDLKNPKGPYPRGQHIQLGNLHPDGENAIRNNKALAILDEECGVRNRELYGNKSNRMKECISYAEDLINIWESHLNPANPLIIEGNQLLGGGPSPNGCSIITDGGSANVHILNNTLVNTTMCGINIAGGEGHLAQGNVIYSKKQSFSNVGIALANTKVKIIDGQRVADNSVPCKNNTVIDNHINWTSKFGYINDIFIGTDPSNLYGRPCQNNTVSNNIHDSSLDEFLLPAVNDFLVND